MSSRRSHRADRSSSLGPAGPILATTVVVVAGLWSAVSLFSDALGGMSAPAFAAVVLGSHALLGALVGLVWPRRWWFAVLGAWGAYLVDFVWAFPPFATGNSMAGAYPGSPLLGLVGIPCALGLGAMAGVVGFRRALR